MLEGKIHQLTADEIRGRDPEEVARYLQEKNIQADTFAIPKELHGMFANPRAVQVFANWVGKYMNVATAAGFFQKSFSPRAELTIFNHNPIFGLFLFCLQYNSGYHLDLIYYPHLPMILDGRLVAATILENIKNQIIFSDTHDRPMLAVVLVGENPASMSYIRMKEKRAREVGMGFGLYRYETTITQGELEEAVRELSKNEKIHGIIVQSPLPSHIDPYAVIDCIDPNKDVDGFTRAQIGNMFLGHDGLWSCTPKGVMTMLRHYQIDVKGKNITVIGRSNIVGKPMTLMLVNAGATVTSCNSSTKNLAEITRKSDIIIVATGKPGLLTKDMVTPESIIIDVGCTFVDGVACGDTNYDDLKDYVAAISPVPGGVGPMTVATLIENTWKAFQMSRENI